MANNNLFAIVTMLLLTGVTGAARSEPTIDDLLTIEKLIETADWRALYTYIESNPRLTAGSSPLASELRSFTTEVERGQLNTFNAVSGGNSEGVGSANDASPAIY